MRSKRSGQGIAAFAYFFARKNARNPRFTFGTGKLGDLAGFASAVVLALIALLIGWESLLRLYNPVFLSPSNRLRAGRRTFLAARHFAKNFRLLLLRAAGRPAQGSGGRENHRAMFTPTASHGTPDEAGQLDRAEMIRAADASLGSVRPSGGL